MKVVVYKLTREEIVRKVYELYQSHPILKNEELISKNGKPINYITLFYKHI